jgi:hypothetical protein
MGEEHSTVEAGGKEYGDAVIRDSRFVARGSRFVIRD